MTRMLRRFSPLLALLAAASCSGGGSSVETGGHDAGLAGDSGTVPGIDAGQPPPGVDAGVGPTPSLDAGGGTDAGTLDAGVHKDSGATSDAGGFSKIKHVVLIVQENKTFDTYFGSYCTAAAGSNPTCNIGPSCCEAAPAKSPGSSGVAPTVLTDSTNSSFDPNHTQACEVTELNGGAMDMFTSGSSVTSCSNAGNFAIAAPATVQAYQTLAATYAVADRYFQPIAGQSSSNDMYFAVAQHVFTDNAYQPNTNGKGCDNIPITPTISYSSQTIADVLIGGGFSFRTYFEGYAAMVAATLCPAAPSDCPAHVPYAPCVYEPGDNPFEYYTQFADKPEYQKDWADLAKDSTASNLPSFSYVKHVQYKNEHPGYGTTISAGMGAVNADVQQILQSPEADSTLILITWDEGGGFFDHVSPPPTSKIDNQPYGTRIPLLAIGKFAKKNYISHVTMEHSSVVRFLEQNFLGTAGQLSARDGTVNAIWDLLDPAETGVSSFQ